MLFRGKPQIWFSRSDDGVTFGVVHPLEGIVLEHEYLEGVSWRSGVSFTTSMSVRLGGVALRGLDFGLMDSHLVA